MQITIEGTMFTIKRIRGSHRMSGRIDAVNNTGRINVPYGVSTAQIKNFAEQVYLSEKSKGKLNLLNDGETLLLLGQEYKIKLLPSAEFSLCFINDTAYFGAPKECSESEKRAYLHKVYRAELIKKIKERLPLCEKKTGLRFESWTVRDMISKWGTCNYVKKRLTVSLRMAQKSVECLDFLLIHELGHLRYPNHGKEFHAYMNEFCPNWKIISKKLNY